MSNPPSVKLLRLPDRSCLINFLSLFTAKPTDRAENIFHGHMIDYIKFKHHESQLNWSKLFEKWKIYSIPVKMLNFTDFEHSESMQKTLLVYRGRIISMIF